ncbi:hypothetical protein [Actinomadura rudentiformis]|uniref:Uncharacterized protein n=1 Tax=Actinomadura rudentiformis TaxID=359158 RepID=A0A6H9YTJ9_9ACTN|nr:hypothetical protein [Actinomadura rudentiformis]KAB2345474.1 hypothetical protein F8566_26245 [Actinomadura rudentiformis]
MRGDRAGQVLVQARPHEDAAAPLVPQLRRIHTLYLAEQERCAGRLAPGNHSFERGIRVTGFALELLG